MFTTNANAQDTPRQRQGQIIVAKKCGSCHAVGRVGESRNPKAPAFRPLRPQKSAAVQAVRKRLLAADNFRRQADRLRRLAEAAYRARAQPEER
jgi:mono/diheme cytochrome c family protein